MHDHNQPIIGMFPEWYPQTAVLIAWPDHYTDFSDILNTIEKTYLEIVDAISRYQIVIIAVRDQQIKKHVDRLLSVPGINKQRIHYVEIPYDDIWVRDTAPIAVQYQDTTHLVAFSFNAWGNQYPCPNDSQFARRFISSQVFATPVKTCSLIIEGGAFDSNGSGEILTTSSCLYDPARNHSSKSDINQQVQEILNINRLIVLESGHLVGDDTGGHIDTLARFCSEETIVYTSCEDPDDPNFCILSQLKKELEQLRTARNTPYRLLPLPLASEKYNYQNQQLPANYANFLIINNAVLVPQYEDKQDKAALSVLGKCFPERSMIPINCLGLIQQYGSLHCMTMNYPITLKFSHIK